MKMRGGILCASMLATLLAACDDPVGPAKEIAGAYELAATLADDVPVPVAPSDVGATLVLRPDRTWLLTRHRSGVRFSSDGFGLTDRYRFEGQDTGLTLSMFSEGDFLALVAGSATVDGDTLRWGAEVFVRR
jgi:hypothetical protein